ncbi:MAG: TRAP transporter small permease subunit [Geminicoccaceae bacterium]|nr:MAG: TRAP transporter small permease subunit [Geminicoccaceae bacterium]
MSNDTPTAPLGEAGAQARLPHTWLSKRIDGLLDVVGSLASWLWIAVVAAIVINVVYRYILRNNIGQLEELQWHLYATAFLIGLAYTVVHDEHVRVDVIYGSRSLRTKAWVDFLGILIFALPFALFVLYYAWPFVVASYVSGERSVNPSGLPYRFLIKGMLVLGFGLLVLAFVSRLTRTTALLFGFPKPIRAER